MHRVMITLPDSILQNTDHAAKKLGQSRSEFIRVALAERLAELRRQEFKALLAEGYKEMAESDAHLADEATGAQSIATEEIWVWNEE